MSETERAAIERLFARYMRAWHDNDMTAWGTCFTPDSDFISWRGVWWRNLEENLVAHRALPADISAQLPKYDLVLEDMVFLRPDVALVHARWLWADFTEVGRAPENREGMLTMVLVKQEGDWRIRATHNARIER